MRALLLSLLLISGLAFCQDYEFDYLLTYQVNQIKPEVKKFDDHIVYINSENHSYNMDSYIFDNQKINYIKDFNAKLNYRFVVLEKTGQANLYNYQYARKFIKDNEKDKRFVNRIEIKQNNENSYSIKAYRNKKLNFVIDVELEKANVNLIYFHLSDISEFTEEKILSEFKRVLSNKNYVVKRIRIDYMNGYVITEELNDVKPLQKKISLPEGIQQMITEQFKDYKED